MRTLFALLGMFFLFCLFSIGGKISVPVSEEKTNEIVVEQQQEIQEHLEKSETECKTDFKNITPYLTDIKNSKAEGAINTYFEHCSKFTFEDKYSFLHRAYSLAGMEDLKNNKFESAITNFEKAIKEAKMSNKLSMDYDMDYIYIGDCYYNTWQMEKAAKYYELANAKRPVPVKVLEKLGDCYYNLKQFDKADMYYQKTIIEVQNLRNELLNNGIYSGETFEDLNQIEQKCQSIIDGTFDQ